jgi:putative transcriptional regulator
MSERTAAQNTVLKLVGNKIQLLRKKKGYSQRELAELLNVTRVYVGYIEQGRESPSLKLLVKVTEVFGISIQDLFKK